MKRFFILFFICFRISSLQAQESKNSFYDSLNRETIYLDSLPLQKVYEMAGNYHYWDKFETSDLIYNYLLEKHFFRTTPTDTTTRLASYSSYMALAHLRMLRHEYFKAQEYLELARLVPQPQHWCGNAIAAQLALEDAYRLECRLGLASSSEKRMLWQEFLNLAFYDDGFGSPHYAGPGVVNYLKASYSDAEIIYLFRKSRETIHVKEHKHEDFSTVEATFQLLGATAHFSFYLEAERQNDAVALHKIAGDYLVSQVKNWISGY